jgi:23S rRNA (adenine2503-C2)-methyltransferase
MSPKKKDIRELSKEELISVFLQKGEPAFRAKQVYEWLWKKNAGSFSEMTNVSLVNREWLSNEFDFVKVSLGETQISRDRTIKCAMCLDDGNVVESVLIPTETRMTACISTQVGCSLTCKFCATGRLKRIRNLSAGEIVDQVVLVKNLEISKYSIPLSNIVYMGMGEPLLNYTETMKSIEKITSEEGLGMSPQRITVSTAGVAKMIVKMGEERTRVNLALSLHAANDEKRNKIMPINETTRVTFEYIVFKDFNDTLVDARELANYCKRVKAKVNIIEYNPIDGGEFLQTLPERLDRFKNYLESNGIIVNVRRSRGKDIDAACGQLANKNKLATSNLKEEK